MSIDLETAHPKDVAQKLGIPVYRTPRRPPNLPFRLPDRENGEEIWLGPGGEFLMEVPGQELNGQKYAFNQMLQRLKDGGKKCVLLHGVHIDNGYTYWVAYFERPKSYLQAQVGLKNLWERRVQTLNYYGIEDGATLPEESDEVEQLNLVFFAPRTIARPPREIFRPGIADRSPETKKGRSGRVTRTRAFREERPPKPPKPPKAPRPPKPPKVATKANLVAPIKKKPAVFKLK